MTTFSELNLITPIQRALADEGYEQPTPIQSKALPPALESRDVLGIAQTGTGKTAAFAIPILNSLGSQNRKASSRRPFALILAPTRELAIQIGESMDTYGRHLHLRTCTIFGGVGYGKQVNQLKRGAHILIATPGRLLDLMKQEHVHLDRLEMFVLDEADRMLDMGFLPSLKKILRVLPKERQSLFFSATLPPSIKSLASELLSDPVRVTIAPQSVTIDKIEQKFFLLPKSQKQRFLTNILSGTDVESAIVFTKTKHGANRVGTSLEKTGVPVAVIHGNKSQNARQKALAAFREKQVRVLVATDVAARGIDIQGVSHVVNFDLPQEPESYVHRIGRTGRAGAEGVAITFCLPDERKTLRPLERLLGTKIHPTPVAPEEGEAPNSSRGSQPRRRDGDTTRRAGEQTARKPRKRRPGQKTSNSAKPSQQQQDSRKKPTSKKAAAKKQVARSADGSAQDGQRPGKRKRKKPSGFQVSQAGAKRKKKRRGPKPARKQAMAVS